MKRFLPILSFILLTTVCAQGQSRGPSPDQVGSIMRFYPNPATSFITFNFQKNFDRGYSIQLYNFLGKKMYEAANVNQQTTINLADYNRGVYIYQLYDRSGKMIESGKFQVSR